MFHQIRTCDRGMLLINLLFLMWVVLIPFSSALIGEYERQQVPIIIYAIHNTLVSLTLTWLWRYAAKEGWLAETNLDPRLARYNKLRALFIPTVFLLSIGLSFLSGDVARLSWLLLVLLTGPILQKYV